MDDQAYHMMMANLYGQQQDRPADVSVQDWKNRYRISAKLSPMVYAQLIQHCQANGLSINSALRNILSSYFQQANG